MKNRKYYYSQSCMGSIEPIESWLKDKDVVLRGRKRAMKGAIKRHRRSIAQRKLHRLFPHLVVKMGYVWLEDDEGIAAVDYPRPKDRVWKGCRRLWIRE